MKTKLLYLIASFAFATNCSAQWATTIDVNLKNGEQIKTIISDGGSMEFYDCDEDLEYVDLGLSVKWAKMNVGASTITEMGDYFYWGDTIKIAEGNNHDSYENYYGRLKDHIAKTKFDVAYKYSGKNWRMPTAEEFKELIEKCDWQVVTYNDTKGYLVVGPNKNYIFLPFDGYYYKAFNNGHSEPCSFDTAHRRILFTREIIVYMTQEFFADTYPVVLYLNNASDISAALR